jgi:hypothetical protein
MRIREELAYHLAHGHQWQQLDDCCIELHVNYKIDMYTTNSYIYSLLRDIPNFEHSNFYAYISDNLTNSMNNFDHDNKRKTLFEVNELLYFTNKIDPIHGANVLEVLSTLIKDKHIDKWANFVETTMSEDSTLFFCYSTIYRLRDYKIL